MGAALNGLSLHGGIRPADTSETFAAYQYALSQQMAL
jgi:transketolase